MVCDVLMIISTFPLAIAAFFAHGWLGGTNSKQQHFILAILTFSEL